MKCIRIFNRGKIVGWFGTDTIDREELEKECQIAVKTAYALGCPFKDEFTAKVGTIEEHILK